MNELELLQILMVSFIYSQLVLIPILGGLFFALKKQNDRRELLMGEAIKALRIIAVSRGKHLK